MEQGNEVEVKFLQRKTLVTVLFFCSRSILITGYLPFEVLGMSVYDYIHQDDLTVYAKAHESREFTLNCF